MLTLSIPLFQFQDIVSILNTYILSSAMCVTREHALLLTGSFYTLQFHRLFIVSVHSHQLIVFYRSWHVFYNFICRNMGGIVRTKWDVGGLVFIWDLWGGFASIKLFFRKCTIILLLNIIKKIRLKIFLFQNWYVQKIRFSKKK